MLMQRLFRLGLAVAAAGLLLPAVGCGDGETAPETPLVVAQAPTKSGDGQEGEAGEQLPSALRVIVTRSNEPVENVEVEWEAGGEGTMSPTTSNTDEDGIAESSWTLDPTPGPQSATARVTDADGSPVTFNATGTEPSEPPPGPPPEP